MRFRYLRDELFLSSLVLYFVNRLILKPLTTHEFIHGYFNDFLCIPFFLPVVLSLARYCRARTNDLPPSAFEILTAIIIWSIMFEIVFPQSPYWSQWVTADAYDTLWYTTGGFLAFWCWEWRYGNRVQ